MPLHVIGRHRRSPAFSLARSPYHPDRRPRGRLTTPREFKGILPGASMSTPRDFQTLSQGTLRDTPREYYITPMDVSGSSQGYEWDYFPLIFPWELRTPAILFLFLSRCPVV